MGDNVECAVGNRAGGAGLPKVNIRRFYQRP